MESLEVKKLGVLRFEGELITANANRRRHCEPACRRLGRKAALASFYDVATCLQQAGLLEN